jgi:uncharacterized protein (TIGR01777 family)
MKKPLPRRIVLAGGTGHVGQVLARHFLAAGSEVVVLTRGTANSKEPRDIHNSDLTLTPAYRTVAWDARTLGSWMGELEGTDVVINLAGRTVNCRYSEANRREILRSRVQSTEVLGQAIGRLQHAPRVWLNASTATIYAHTFGAPNDEASGRIGGDEPDVPADWHFSIEVAKSWERAFFAANTPHTRKIALRSAMTMSADRGSVFDELLRLVRFGLGGASGSGKQYVSWIHEFDFARAIDFLIGKEDLDGPVNVASPAPLPNAEFMRALRQAWGIPVGLPATEWMLSIGALVIGTETELILKSRRVVPGRLLERGFQFTFPEWRAAAMDLVEKWRTEGRGQSSDACMSAEQKGAL